MVTGVGMYTIYDFVFLICWVMGIGVGMCILFLHFTNTNGHGHWRRDVDFALFEILAAAPAQKDIT